MLFAGALGTQLIAAFEPQAGFWPLAALFGLGLLVLLAGGRARGWGLWLLLGAALGLVFSARTGAQFDALTAAYGGRTVRLTATVEDKVEAEGVVLFQETLIPGSGDLGYLAEDGARVSAGTVGAEV